MPGLERGRGSIVRGNIRPTKPFNASKVVTDEVAVTDRW
jgi:hypothetical protein